MPNYGKRAKGGESTVDASSLARNCPEDISKLSSDGQLIVNLLKDEINQLRQEFLTTINEKNSLINSLSEEVIGLKKRISKLESSLDDSDAYERRDTIIISGPEIPQFSTGENPVAITQKLIRDCLKIEVPASDINTVHRLGKKPTNQAPDKRSLILKLCRRDLKRELISASYRQERPTVFLSESLTPIRRTILYSLRKIRRSHPDIVLGCSSFDGRVFAKIKSSSATAHPFLRVFINSHEDLVRFCREHVKKDLDNFLDQWTH